MNVCYVGGAGRLGSALAAWSAHSGHQVTIADTGSSAVEAINERKTKYSEPHVDGYLNRGVLKGKLIATTDINEAVKASEVIYIIVPTPSLDDGSFSMEYVENAMSRMACGLKENAHELPLVVIVSTVNPGDTASIQEVLNQLEREVLVVYSPEFVAQGSIIKDFANPDVLLVGADDDRAVGLALEAYAGVVDAESVHVMSTVSAEIAKIGLNAALVTKTAVAAQLMWLCHNTPGADAYDVLGSVGADGRIGSKFFAPGLRPGGPCLPRDNRALIATRSHFHSPVEIALATDAYSKIQDRLLLEQVQKWCKGNILIIGLTYKPGVPIEEDSAGMQLYDSVKDIRGAKNVRAYDELLVPNNLTENTSWAGTVVITTRRPPEMDLTGKIVIDCWGQYEGDCEKHIILGVGV